LMNLEEKILERKFEVFGVGMNGQIM
jgi:hypothetical protein